jgi:hypothetical protein
MKIRLKGTVDGCGNNKNDFFCDPCPVSIVFRRRSKDMWNKGRAF